MISLLLIRKHINRRFDLIHKTYQAEISLLSSRIAALESRLSRVEGSAADADGKVSRPWQISKEGNVTLEKAVVETALISSGIITNGKVSSKEAKTSGDTGLRANFGSGRADSTGLLLEQALPSHNTTHTPGTKAPHSQGQSPRTTTTTTGMTAEALEGMTLDAPIRPFHQVL
ncbi:hypothetical protein [Klebsiella pneumoniae]|uniref:hypothetical protein n=1 Tax=Klebsiella pneumoniae TaxID=573 RepID=UPI00296E7BEE|nr:hypothetical protein [Klebsiella pneumoniae]MDW3810578.1 hypothetical protein [Klebsiella pneumoniae]